MKFYINIKKRHTIAIIAMIVLIGIVIAQTPPNPGHAATQVAVGGSVNNNLETWANSANNAISDHETRVNALESGRWTSISASGGPLCWPNAQGVCPVGIVGTNYRNFVPQTAKEILVYVWVNKCPSGITAAPAHFSIYTQEGATQYIQKLVVNDHNTAACRFNSDNLWLPATSDPNLYIALSSQVTSVNSGIEFLGYR